MFGRSRRPTLGGVRVNGHPAAEHDAEGEEKGRDDQRGEQQDGRTPLVSPELFKRRVAHRRRRVAFVVRRCPLPFG